MWGKGPSRDSLRPVPESSATFSLHGRRHKVAKTPRMGILCLIGLCGGTFGGLLGIGGGSAIAPLLLLLGTLRPAQVSGTTLATVVVISIVGSGAYASLGHLNLELAWPIALGSGAGAIGGALFSNRLSSRLMAGIFLTLLPYLAIKEFWPEIAAPAIPPNIVSLALLGFATGIFSGLLGIGGASLVVPSLVAFFFVDHHTAQGIAMAAAMVDSVAGALTHAQNKNIHYHALPYLAIPAPSAAVAGAFLSHSLSVRVLRNLFGTFMVVIWASMVVRLIKDYVPGRRRDTIVPLQRDLENRT